MNQLSAEDQISFKEGIFWEWNNLFGTFYFNLNWTFKLITEGERVRGRSEACLKGHVNMIKSEITYFDIVIT